MGRSSYVVETAQFELDGGEALQEVSGEFVVGSGARGFNLGLRPEFRSQPTGGS